MKFFQINWYNFIHEKVSELHGGAEFINSFSIKDEDQPVAVYKAKNPDRTKGHKDYILLQIVRVGLSEVQDLTNPHEPDDRVMIRRGMNEAEMRFHRYRDALHCYRCDHVVFSVSRHDMRSCACGSAAIDGGSSYLRYSGDPAHFELVTLDMLTNQVIRDPIDPALN